VVVATRHDSHAHLVCRVIEAGKHVFVEKPLAITSEDLERIGSVCASASPAPLLMVGFNRRFAPQIVKMKSLLAGVRVPKSIVITINAGAIPSDHWTQDPAQGGGRIVGEGCHFIDLARFVAGAKIAGARVPHVQGACGDSLSFVLEFEDGSTAAIQYLASGHKSFPKERVEVVAAGRILQLDNFRSLRGWGWPGFRKMNLWRQDKGNAACVTAFVNALRIGGPSPIPLDELLEVSRATLEVNRLATKG
jgi:predicted dehydrogenase